MHHAISRPGRNHLERDGDHGTGDTQEDGRPPDVHWTTGPRGSRDTTNRALAAAQDHTVRQRIWTPRTMSSPPPATSLTPATKHPAPTTPRMADTAPRNLARRAPEGGTLSAGVRRVRVSRPASTIAPAANTVT